MKAMLHQAAQQVRRSRPASAPAVVRVQRSSTLGGLANAPAVADAGVALHPAVRRQMETGFGQDFSAVRVHDDAKAHDSALALGARAYAAGNDLVFGAGQYRPDTPAGQGLIAHELAHTVQQGGVQMKADGPLPASADRALEAEADRASAAIADGRPMPTLSRIGRPAIMRNDAQQPAPVAVAKKSVGSKLQLSPEMEATFTAVDNAGGIGASIAVSLLRLPHDKGVGPWVEAVFKKYAASERLTFSPIIDKGGQLSAFKEKDAVDYKKVWLTKYGFNSTADIVGAFDGSTNPDAIKAKAKTGVPGLLDKLKGSTLDGVDIDHIVEKQLGGSSNGENLQLLDSAKNQTAGSKTWAMLQQMVADVRAPNKLGPDATKLRFDFKDVQFATPSEDPSFVVENALRQGWLADQRTKKKAAAAGGEPVALTAGGATEVTDVRKTGRTPIDLLGRRMVHGMRLKTYVRGPANGSDIVEAVLDNDVVEATATAAPIKLTATKISGAVPPPPSDDGATSPVPTEARRLELSSTANKNIAFRYPYLSPGALTSVSMDEKGNLSGTGYIRPTIPLFKQLDIEYGPDMLKVVAPIKAADLKLPFPGRFTSGSIALQLAPTFAPSGDLTFEIGPAAKPVILGKLKVFLEGSAIVATGELTPAGKLPGIDAAKGEVKYHSVQGWSGKLTATSSTLPGASRVNAELGFRSGQGGVELYGRGGITSKIRNADLNLEAAWHGGPISYKGGATVKDPLPLVKSVDLMGSYANDTLSLTGKAAIVWNKINADLIVTYMRKDGEPDGKFSGSAEVKLSNEKMAGRFMLAFDDAGDITGKGSLSYQVTKTLRPTLGVAVDKRGVIKLSGEVVVGDIPLSKMWPAPNGKRVPIVKGVGIKFSIPTPVPGVTAFGEVRGSLGVGYGVGPVMLKGVVFKGELYPLEDDPKVKAELKGALSIPAYGELYGTFGAFIGAEVLLGVAGAKGGIEISPTLGIKGEAAVNFRADYDAEGFGFSAEAGVTGQMYAKLGVDLKAEIYALGGIFSHEWTYPVAAISKQLGPELKIKLGKIAYAKNGEITWPDPSQIDISPKDFEPMSMVRELMSEGKATEK